MDNHTLPTQEVTMTLSTPARSDLHRPEVPADTPPTAQRPYHRHGIALSVGAVCWAVPMALFGIDYGDGAQAALQAAGSGVFQVGLLFLLRVLWRTRALGEGRLARVALRAEAVAVVLAMGSTLADGLGVSDLGQVQWALLDAFWPLSMLGMFLIGVRIAVHGRWTGPSRFWPLVAESWAVVVIPTLGIFGESAAAVVAPLHLLVGYAVLGVLVSRKQD